MLKGLSFLDLLNVVFLFENVYIGNVLGLDVFLGFPKISLFEVKKAQLNSFFGQAFPR